MNFRRTLLACSAASFLVACAAPLIPAKPAPKFAWGQPVVFEGVTFNFNSARTTPSFTNWVNQRTNAAESFLIVEVTMVNKTGSPMPHHFQPIFRLMDDSGAVYEPHVQHSVMINMQQPGRIEYGSNMNPNTNIKQEIVFEVPRRKYMLQVIVPNRARVGFGGSITSSGSYFLYDISSQLAG